jgi:lipopolysaccharide/colanic/teichoic acid biosynthesis glycosyltransferase
MTIHYSDMPAQVDATSTEALIEATRPRTGLYRSVAKRAIDVLILLAAAPLTVPVILAMALVVFLRTGSNPFYAQKRIGKDHRVFTMWKVRTMVVDADQRLEAYLASNPEARAEWDSTQKLKNDPRITPIGRVLRKTSLDELPQLWNVFVGDMSLVGPRPMMPEQKVLYPGNDYYQLRPGITGLWQISDRNEVSFASRAQFDAKYNSTVSATTDAAILLATVSVVVKGTGY